MYRGLLIVTSEPTAQGPCATAASELSFAAAPLHYRASADGHP